MSDTSNKIQSMQLSSAKIISCILPDDGTDIKLMRQLKDNKDLTRVESIACRGVHHLQQVKTRAGKLPEPILNRLLSVVVSDERADEIFDFICQTAQIGEPDRGIVLQTTLLGATAYSIPDDVPDEKF